VSDGFVAQAEGFAAVGDRAGALQLVDMALRDDAVAAATLTRTARLLGTLRDRRRRPALATRALAALPDLDAADALILIGQPAPVVAALGPVLPDDAGLGHAMVLAQALERCDRWREALAVWRAYLAHHPDDLDALVAAGWVAVVTKSDLADAVEWFTRAMRVKPDAWGVLAQLIQVRQFLGEHQAARALIATLPPDVRVRVMRYSRLPPIAA
jgi:tetratricopeptide (TPR) repeat protein